MMVLDEMKKMTKAELLELARENKLRVTSQMSKNELLDAIMAASKKRKEPLALNAPARAKVEVKDQAADQRKVLAAKRAAKRLFTAAKKKSKIKTKPEPEAMKAPAPAARPTPEAKPTPAPVRPPLARPSIPERPAQARPLPPAERLMPKAPRPLTDERPTSPRPATPPPPATVAPPKPAEDRRPAPPKPAEVRPATPSKPSEDRRPAAPPKPAAAERPAPPRPAPPKPAPPSASPPRVEEKPAAKRGRKKGSTGKPESKRPSADAKKTSDEEIRQRAEEGKYYLGADQQVMPPVEAIEIPAGYNVDRIVALVRDPYWIFAYWEVTDRKFRELERLFKDDWPKCRMILRVFDRTNEKPAHFDIDLTGHARNWYINVSSERRYQVAIGALSPDGRFEQIAISNVVETPSYRVSDRIDEEWMIPDDVFKRIFDASGGRGMHASSAELKQLLERRFLEEVSSGAVSSFGSGMWPTPARGFRLWVATELILYGGTEPDARVTVQGKEVKLRPDGTFSLRFALPDGKIGLPVTAASADGVEERTIATDVSKKSEKKAPVVK